MVVIDTSGLLAALDDSETGHAAALEALRAARPPRLLSPCVLTELDYLFGVRQGESARLDLLGEVERGVYELAAFSPADVAAARSVVERHAGLGVSLADASIVVLAEARGTQDVLTFDERHFRVLSAAGKPFRLLPADG